MPDPSVPPTSSRSTPSVDIHSVTTTYANYMRASGSAEELILEFGLDPHRQTGNDREPVVMLQRLILTWGNARRLSVMLQELLQHHDKAEGQPQSRRPPSTPPAGP